MDSTNNGGVMTPDMRIKFLLGEKDVQIAVLSAQIDELRAKLAERRETDPKQASAI
jgi:hypothetical protein